MKTTPPKIGAESRGFPQVIGKVKFHVGGIAKKKRAYASEEGTVGCRSVLCRDMRKDIRRQRNIKYVIYVRDLARIAL